MSTTEARRFRWSSPFTLGMRQTLGRGRLRFDRFWSSSPASSGGSQAVWPAGIDSGNHGEAARGPNWGRGCPNQNPPLAVVELSELGRRGVGGGRRRWRRLRWWRAEELRLRAAL